MPPAADGPALVTVTVAVTGTATAGTDFGDVVTSVTFADGEDTASITIPITNDTADEADETIVLTLSAPTGGATLGTTPSTTVTVTDDDEPLTPIEPLDSRVVVSGQPNGTAQVYQVGGYGAL